MSIEKLHGMYMPVCDICGEDLDTDEDIHDFYDAVAAKKNAGWKSRKSNGEWQDVCRECQAHNRQQSG